jgi:peptidoglycan/xylan/chitin deacetylase (PgdA/CDA1 family)
VCLAYHRVLPLQSGAAYPLDVDLVSASPSEFDSQMDYVRTRMTPLSLAEVAARLDCGEPLPPRAVAVTIDDGFRDAFVHAYPVLRRHGVPATVFLSTGFVDSGEPFWFELAAHLLMSVPPHSLELPGRRLRLPSGDSVAERRAGSRELLTGLKQLGGAERDPLLRDWSRQFSTLLGPATLEHLRPVSWAEAREMSGGGVDFGSHTVTHPTLASLRDDEARRELEDSKRRLEQQLGRAVCALAYPLGMPGSYDARIKSLAEQAGYRLAMSYLPGANWSGAVDRFDVRRTGISYGTDAEHFRALVRMPDWFR